jgi:hypothetical protein
VERLASARAAAGATLIATALTGCVTTQQKNARTLLLNARTLASQAPLRVTRANPSVHVAGIAVVGGAALVVRLHNGSDRPASDLPIEVGVVTGSGRRTTLNRAAGIGYYQAHVPSIAAGATTSWVLTRGTPKGRPFAIVGVSTRPAGTTARALPRIETVQSGAPKRNTVRANVSNHSGIPQYGLQIYGVATRDKRYVAAARAVIGELDGGGKAAVKLRFVGDLAGAAIRLYALPTIFD